MKYTITGLVALIAIAVILFGFKETAKDVVTNKRNIIGVFEPVAVIELFTSQGCSSCPSADKLLSKTIHNSIGKKIFALSYHVDYWNRLGWADPFSNAAFSKRQNDYVASLNINGAYTPQIVVNGSREFVGSDKNALSSSLGNALAEKTETSFSGLEVLQEKQNLVRVKYKLEGNYSGTTINFALVSLSETTQIKRGENEGLTLTNENIVRQLVTQKPNEKGEVTFAISPVPAVGNAAIIIFIQRQNGLKIIGAAMAKI